MQLAELQAQFSRAMLERKEEALLGVMAPSAISPSERLGIYRINVTETLMDALRETFPAVQALVGEMFFHQMAYHFVTRFPPDQACLIWYGGAFATFIEAYAPAQTVPYLAEMAQYEWALNTARFAKEDAPLNISWLESQQEEALRSLPLHLRASASLLMTTYPIGDIHAFALHPDTVQQPDVTEEGEYLALWRDGGEVKTHKLTPCQYSMLAAFARGDVLAEVIEAVSQQHPEFDPAEGLAWVFALHILAQPSTMATNAGQPEEGENENGL